MGKQQPINWQAYADRLAADPANQTSRQIYNVNLSEYEDYLKNVDPYQDINRQRALAQSTAQKLWGGTVQSVAGILGTGVGSIGALYEAGAEALNGIASAAGVAGRRQSDFDNILLELGRDIEKTGEQMAPIYRENPDKPFDVSDSGWWASQMPSITSAFALMLPAAGVVKAGSWAARMAGLSEVVAPGAKWAAKLATGAAFQRNAENFGEAFDVFEQGKAQVLSELQDPIRRDTLLRSEAAREAKKALGIQNEEITNEELANYIAGKGAWRAYQINSANIGFDLLQFAPILKNFRQATRNGVFTSSAVKEAAGKAITRWDRLQDFIPVAGEVLGEGVEEGVNFAGGKEGNNYIQELLGKQTKDFSGRLGDYLSDGHFWEATLMGAVGGGLGAAYGHWAHPDTGPLSDNSKIGEIASRKVQLAQMNQELEEASKLSMPDEDKKDLIANIKSKHSFLLGINAAKAGNVDLLLESLNDKEFQKSLVENGVTDEEDIAKAVAKTKEDILTAEKLYKKHSGLVFGSGMTPEESDIYLYELANLHYMRERGNTKLAELESQISEEKAPLAHVFAKPNAQTLLTHRALVQAIKEVKKNPQYKALQARLEEKLQNFPQPETKGLRFGSSLVNKATLKEVVAANNELLAEQAAELDSKKGRKAVQERVRKAKESRTEEAFKQFKARVDAETDMKTLSDIVAHQSRMGNQEWSNYASDKLLAMRKVKEDENKRKVRQQSVAASKQNQNAPVTPVVSATSTSSPDTEPTSQVQTGTPAQSPVESVVEGSSPVTAPEESVVEGGTPADVPTEQVPTGSETPANEPTTAEGPTLQEKIREIKQKEADAKEAAAAKPDQTVTDTQVAAANQPPTKSSEVPVVTKLDEKEGDLDTLIDSLESFTASNFYTLTDDFKEVISGRVTLYPNSKSPEVRKALLPTVVKAASILQKAGLVKSIHKGSKTSKLITLSDELLEELDNRLVKATSDFVESRKGKYNLDDLRPVQDKVFKEFIIEKFKKTLSTSTSSLEQPTVVLQESFSELSGVLVELMSTPFKLLQNNLAVNAEQGIISQELTYEQSKLTKLLMDLRPGDTLTIRRADLTGSDRKWNGTNADDYRLGVFVGDTEIGTINTLTSIQNAIKKGGLSDAATALMIDKLSQVAQIRDLYRTDPNARISATVSEITGGAITRMDKMVPSRDLLTELMQPDTGRLVICVDAEGVQLLNPATKDIVAKHSLEPSEVNSDGVYTPGTLYVLVDGYGGKKIPSPIRSISLGANPQLLAHAAHKLVDWLDDLQNARDWNQANEANTMYINELQSFLRVSTVKGAIRATERYIEIPLPTGSVRFYVKNKGVGLQEAQVIRDASGEPFIRLGFYDADGNSVATPEGLTLGKALTSGLSVQKVSFDADLLNDTGKIEVAGIVYDNYNQFVINNTLTNMQALIAKDGSKQFVSPMSINFQGTKGKRSHKGVNLKISPLLTPSPSITPVTQTVQPTQRIQEAPVITPTPNPEEEYYDDFDPFADEDDLLSGDNFSAMMKADDTLEGEREDFAAMKDWWGKTFDGVPFEQVQGLINNGGQLAFGLFTNAGVKISSLAVKGTAYHEAFHVAMHLYQTAEQREAIYAEARKLYGDKSAYDLEEDLAEAFRRYMIANEKPKSNPILQFFKDLWNLIKAFVNGQGRTMHLFNQIKGGHFKLPPNPRIYAYAKTVTAAKPVDGFSYIQQNRIVTNVMPVLNSMIAEMQSPAFAQRKAELITKYGSGEKLIGLSLKAKLKKTAEQVGEQFAATYATIDSRFWDGEYGQGLWYHIKKRYQQDYGIDIDGETLEREATQEELDMLESMDVENLTKDWDDSSMTMNMESFLSGKLKGLIKSTYSLADFDFTAYRKNPVPLNSPEAVGYRTIKKSDLLGIAEYVDFKKTYSFLQQYLSGVRSEQELMDRLEYYTQTQDPSLGLIWAKLDQDPLLKKAMFSHFAKQNMDVRLLYMTPDKKGVQFDWMLVNRNRVPYILADKFEQQVTAFMAEGFDEAAMKLTNQKLNKVLSDRPMSVEAVAKAYSEALKALGISLVEGDTDVIQKAVKASSKDAKDLYRWVERYNFIYGAVKNKGGIAEEKTNLRRLGTMLAPFKTGVIQHSMRNAENKQIFGVTLPNYISRFFDELKPTFTQMDGTPYGREGFKRKLLDYLRDDQMKNSNWMKRFVQFEGNEVVKDERGLPVLNEEEIARFSYALSGEMKTSDGKALTYSSMSESDYYLYMAGLFAAGRGQTKADSGLVSFPIMIPSDGGTMYSVTMPEFFGFESKGKISQNEALLNIVIGEIAAMRQAKQHILTPGSIKQQFYHTDKNRNSPITPDGKAIWKADPQTGGKLRPVAGGLRFQAFDALNDMKELFDQNGFIRSDNDLDAYMIRDLVLPVIEKQLNEEAERIHKAILPHKEALKKTIQGQSESVVTDEKFKAFARDLAANHMIFNHEYQLWFGGTTGEFKSWVDSNKRLKWVVAPGTASADTGVIRMVTLRDVERPSAILEQIEKGVRQVMGAQVDEAKVQSIVDAYSAINTADGQGYMTLARYEQVLKDNGRWNDRYAYLTQQAKDGVLTRSEFKELFLPIKPFYGYRGYDQELGRVSTKMVKYSSVPLLPQFTKGSELDKLRIWMEKENVGEAVYESAHKVGITEIIDLHGDESTFTIREEALTPTAIRSYPGQGWQIQLDVPDHLVDTTNKLGTQIAKLITANLDRTGTYLIGGKEITGHELLDNYHTDLSTLVERAGKDLLDRLGATIEDGNVIVQNLDGINQVLQSELERRDLGEVVKELAQYDKEKGRWIIPLYHSAAAEKFQSVLLSLFTNNVTNLKHPGFSAVVVSSAFLEYDEAADVELLDSFASRPSRKLLGAHLDANGVMQPAEVLLPAFMKSMFDKNINEIDPKLLEIIGYRIPTEKKSSMAPMKVVGFLPPSMGSTLVTPDEFVVQMGSDFDVDKLFTMQRHAKAKEGSTKLLQNNVFDTYWSILTSPKHYLEMVAPQGFDTLKAVAAKVRAIDGVQDGANPVLASSQAKFFRQNSVGKALKGIAADANTFGSVAQDTRMKLALSMIVRYEKSEGYDLDKLAARYGKNVKEQTSEYIDIKHQNLGWNNDGSFVNADGVLITDAGSEGVAAAVDGVKDPVYAALNGDTFTYMPSHTAILAGVPIDTAWLMTAQPIIKNLAKEIQKGKGLFASPESTKANFKKQQELLEKRLKSFNINVSRKAKEAYNKLSDEEKAGRSFIQVAFDRAKVPYTDKPFSRTHLTKLLTDSKNVDKLPRNERAAFYADQYRILEDFYKRHQNAQAISEMVRITKTDKVGAGPTTDATNSLIHTINRSVVSGMIRVRMGDLTAAEAIYPKHFGLDHKSIYPPLEAYLTYANKSAMAVASKVFLHEMPAGRKVIDKIMQEFPDFRYDEKLARKARKYLSTRLLLDAPFFANTNVKQLFGQFDHSEDFAKAKEGYPYWSAAKKLSYIKNTWLPAKLASATTEAERSMYSNMLHNPDHLLQKLTPLWTKEDVGADGLATIKFLNESDAILDNQMQENFEELFAQPEGSALRLLAEDLIRYNAFSTGMSFARQSFSKLFGMAVQQGIGMPQYYESIEGKLSDSRGLAHYAEDSADVFFRSNWNDPEIVPRIGTVYDPALNAFVDEASYAPDNSTASIYRKNAPAYFLRQVGKSFMLYKRMYSLRDMDGKFESWEYERVDMLGVPGKLIEFGPGSVLKANRAGNPPVQQQREGTTRELPQTTAQKVKFFKDAFKSAGITVTVLEDRTLTANAQIEYIDGAVLVIINPDRVFGDTVIHEFGHLLVDLLGNDPLVAEGIAQLRGSKLWEEVARLYPELSEEQLAKEVLVTAIGREGETIWREEKKQSYWRTLLNRIFRAIGKLFRQEPSAARQLAQKLLSGSYGRLDGVLLNNLQQSRIIPTIAEFREQTRIDIEKRMRRFTHNEKYQAELRNVINTVTEETDEVALQNLAIYTERTLRRVNKRLQDFESTNVVGMSDTEREEVLKSMMDSIMHLDATLDSVSGFERLLASDYPPALATLIEDLQANTGTVTNLKARLGRLRKEIVKGILQPLSTNPDVLSGAVDLLDNKITEFYTAVDETAVSRWLDPLADTKNTFIGTLMKLYNREAEKTRMATQKDRKAWKDLVKEMKSAGMSVNDFVDQTTKRFIIPINWAGFEQARSEMYETTALNGKAGAIDRREWFKENLVPDGEVLARLEEVADEFGKDSDEYRELWAMYNEYDEQSKDWRWKREFMVPNPKRWTDPRYTAIQNDPVKKAYYDRVIGLMNDLLGSDTSDYFKKGYIPAVRKDLRTTAQALKDALLPNLDDRDPEDEVTLDSNGRRIGYIPRRYSRLLGKEKYLQIPQELSERLRKGEYLMSQIGMMTHPQEIQKAKAFYEKALKEEKAIRRENVQIRKRNEAYHIENVDGNLEETMLLFIDTARNFQNKKRLDPIILMAREELHDGSLLSANKKDKIASDVTGKPQNVEIEGSASELLKHLDDWIRMVHYEDFAYEDKGKDWAKWASALQNALSFTSIGFNPFSAISNVAYGTLQTRIEAAAGEFFTTKSLRKAGKEYNTNIARHLFHSEDDISTSKAEAAIKLFDVLQSQDELSGKQGGVVKSKLEKMARLANKAYALQHMGEHAMQNKVLLAMLIDQKATLNGEETTLYDALVFEGGTLSIPEGLEVDGKPFTENEMADFVSKVKGVNQYLHGVYNREDAGTMQKYALGRLAIQFRKWMRRGWSKRFGAEFGEASWNERLAKREEGTYVTAWNYLRKLATDWQNISTNYKLFYEALDRSGQANIKRAGIELTSLLGMILVGELTAMLAEGLDDDDSYLKRKGISMLAYQADRLKEELLFYTPPGLISEGRKLIKSPAAILKPMEDVTKLFMAAGAYPFQTEEERQFEGGRYYGRDRVSVYAVNLLPFVNQIQRLDTIESNTRYYSLF